MKNAARWILGEGEIGTLGTESREKPVALGHDPKKKGGHSSSSRLLGGGGVWPSELLPHKRHSITT